MTTIEELLKTLAAYPEQEFMMFVVRNPNAMTAAARLSGVIGPIHVRLEVRNPFYKSEFVMGHGEV